MANRRSAGEIVFDSANICLLIFLSAITLYPLLFVLFSSISDPKLLVSERGLLIWPAGFSLKAYRAVIDNPMIGVGYMNTLLYVTIGTVLNMVITSFAAYALSRKDVLWRNPIMFMIVFTMFFSGGLIPTFILIQDLGMMDTRWALILPGAMSAFNMIVMYTSFQALPAALEESAKLEGAHDFTILFRIVLPISLPIVAVMILFYGVAHWNSWFPASIYLRNRDLFPLQLVLRDILIANDTQRMLVGARGSDQSYISDTIKYATIMMATVPILALYPFLQKYFVKGVLVGSIKG